MIITLALWNVITLWTAPSRTAWLTDLTILATCFVLTEGLGAPAQQPRLPRRTVETGAAAAALASAARLPGLPSGNGVLGLTGGAVLLAALLVLVAVARTHTWRAPLSQPLRFPLEGSGTSCRAAGGLSTITPGYPNSGARSTWWAWAATAPVHAATTT